MCRSITTLWGLEPGATDNGVEVLGQATSPHGGLWIGGPKKTAKVPTDTTGDIVREVALSLGLADNKVCALNGTWSGLSLVWCRENR
ncbi:MAG: DUF2277 domain-containing protein [Actinomycetia bacterium]|nr:DUF2277 domain-containing protein [Actinomycetes bacterium]